MTTKIPLVYRGDQDYFMKGGAAQYPVPTQGQGAVTVQPTNVPHVGTSIHLNNVPASKMDKWEDLNKIVNNSIEVNQVPYANPIQSQNQLYTIKAGTILYHGSVEKASFNPYRIVLGKDSLVSYFTTSKKLSADYILGCANYPSKSGYIHKFKVKKDIPNILIISPHEKEENWDEKYIETNFCFKKMDENKVSSLTGILHLSGIGFFYPSESQKSLFDDNSTNSVPSSGTLSEFALCEPSKWLEYISTQRCVAVRQLSKERNFTMPN